MGVTIKRMIATHKCWGGDDKFEKWADTFRTKSTYVSDSDVDGKLSRVPLQHTLEKIRRMKLWVKDVTCLEKNLLFACYQAAHSKLPEDYSDARRREERKLLPLQIESQKKFSKRLLAFITRNPTMVTEFFYTAQKMPTEGRNLVLATSEEKLNMLAGLLAEYEYGLENNIDIEFPLGIDAAFRIGPFLFEKEVLEIEKRQAPNVTELGLIFHLTFLFRYFTAKSAPRTSPGSSMGSDFFGDELRVGGEMLSNGGQPCYAQVAALVNATLGKRFQTNDMKLRLKDLLAPKKGASAQLAGRKNYIEFAGWEINKPA